MEAIEAPALAVGGPSKWAPLGGALYVVLFVIGVILLLDGPDGDSAPAKVISYYSDSGHRDRINVGWILTGLAIFFFLWFVAALRRAVLAIDGEGILATVVGIGGTIYAALAFTAASLDNAVRTMSDDTFQHRVFPELIHAADDATWVIHAAGAAGMAAMIIAASSAFMTRGVWSSRVGWLGIVVGILSLGSVAFFPQFLFLLWVLFVSIFLFMQPARYGGTAAPMRGA
jgi:hypothetical protein